MSLFPTVRSLRPAAVVPVLALLAAVTALLALSGTAHAADRNCSDFTSQAEAQAALEADRSDPDNLDSNKNGVACETLLPDDAATTTDDDARAAALVVSSTTTTTSATSTTSSSSTTSTSTTSSSTTETTPTTSTSSNSDDSDSDSDSDDSGSSSDTPDGKNCADFATQADAQAALAAKPSDPDNLDADNDGIACEQQFGETGQQVQVHPTGGVDTGGDPTDA